MAHLKTLGEWDRIERNGSKANQASSNKEEEIPMVEGEHNQKEEPKP